MLVRARGWSESSASVGFECGGFATACCGPSVCKSDRLARVHQGAEIRHPRGVKSGSGTVIGDNVILDGRNGITIGRNVNFSSQVATWTAQHDLRDPAFGIIGGAAVVGDWAWLSFRSTVLPGVRIGEAAVVAAGAVVVEDVAPQAVVAGVPAKPVAVRPQAPSYEMSHWGNWFI